MDERALRAASDAYRFLAMRTVGSHYESSFSTRAARTLAPLALTNECPCGTLTYKWDWN